LMFCVIVAISFLTRMFHEISGLGYKSSLDLICFQTKIKG
jgi:hypothetical protein